MITFYRIAGVGLLLLPVAALAWSVRCSLGLAQCIQIQNQEIPIAVVERMATDCADFMRNNNGIRVLRMSWRQIQEVSGGHIDHPLLRASLAYDSLHDSPLRFDRRLPIDKRYFSVKRACGHVFLALRIAPPSEDY
jgi:hypothetical protein